ncbi:MAG: AMP-binding protein, partial [Pseudomonadota bacterium]
MGWMKDETGLGKNAANFVPMTPLSHLRRAAHVFPETEAVIYGKQRYTYRDYYGRCSRLASALVKMGVEPGDVVATLLPNVPAHAEAHFGVPACGAVLNTINTRLEADTIAYIFDHGEAKVALVDPQFLPVTAQAIELMEGPAPTIIEVPDDAAGVHAFGDYVHYEDFLAGGDPDFDWLMPEDEWESLALNYTSGTTGRPKGVVYHHRGAYMLTLGTAITWPLPRHSRYLTIVPLFHCNNWNHTWTMPMIGGTLICCRDITASAIYNAIADEGVTHFGAAPIVLNMIVNAKDEERREFDHIVSVFTAGAPPPAATLRAIEPLGFDVTQVYGLTETYGHVTECMWHEKWNDKPEEERYAIKARTGILMPFMEDITSMDPETMTQVPMDGSTQGEVMIRGNSVMKGYLKNAKATEEAFAGGYFHSGDIAYQHDDGYLKIADRAKDIII